MSSWLINQNEKYSKYAEKKRKRKIEKNQLIDFSQKVVFPQRVLFYLIL